MPIFDRDIAQEENAIAGINDITPAYKSPQQVPGSDTSDTAGKRWVKVSEGNITGDDPSGGEVPLSEAPVTPKDKSKIVSDEMVKSTTEKSIKTQLEGKTDKKLVDNASKILGDSTGLADVLAKLDAGIEKQESKRDSVKLMMFGLSMLSGEGIGRSVQVANQVGGFNKQRINELYSQRKELQTRITGDALNKAGIYSKDVQNHLLKAQIDKEYGTGKSGSGSKRVFNLEWRNPQNGQVEVRAGRRNADGDFQLQDESGEWVDAYQVTGTTDIRVAPRSADPGVEAGAGGIPNASSYNDTTKVPTFEFQRESEAKAYGYVVRAIGADQKLTQIESEISPQKISSLYGGLAQWASRNANAKITAAVLNDYLRDAGLQQYSREMTKYLQAVLRTDTGAAYTGTEISDYLSAFGIAPGTEVTPEILKQFQLGRKQEIGAQIGRTGKAGAYLNGLLAGEYEIPYSSVVGSTASGDGTKGQTSSGINWKIK